jgi:translocation and assembly module TamB
MRRVLRRLGWIVAALLGVPLLLVALLVLALNTGPGQRFAASLVNRMAGDTATLHGLYGRFPDRLRAARIELRDVQGTYAVIGNVALDWAPLRLLHHDVAISRLVASVVTVQRLPVSSGAGASSGSSGALPLRVDIDTLHVDRLELAAPVAGTAAAMAADGSAHLASLRTGHAALALRRLDAPGSYRITARIDPASLAAELHADEPVGGFLATVTKLPGLGPLDIQASLDGPWSAAATRLAVVAGKLRLEGSGTINLDGRAADLDLTATAPAMTPRPDVSWQSVALDAHVHGPFERPQARGTVRIAGLRAAGAAIGQLAADVAGDAGGVRLTAHASDVRVPGPNPDLFAGAPVTLAADLRLDAPERPLRFTLAHTLLRLAGTAKTAGAPRMQAHLAVPDLAPLAAAAGADLRGSAALDLTAAEAAGTTTATVDGTLGITGGMAPAPGLLGPAARIGATVTLRGSDVTLTRLDVSGQTMTLAAHGGMSGGRLDLDWQAGLSDLSVVAATVQGRLDGHGRVAGAMDDLAAQADLSGEVATAGAKRGPIRLTLNARGLPGRPAGRIAAQGELDGAPLTLDAAAERDAGGTLRIAVSRADWKSAHAEGAVALPPDAMVPLGELSLRMARLDDLSRLLGAKFTGSIAVSLAMSEEAGRPTARVQLQARDAGMPGTAAIGSAKLDATVRDPTTDPDVTAALDLGGLRVGSLGASARLTASGKQSALGLRLQATVQGLAGAELRAGGAATADVPASRITLSALDATWKGETLRLLAPARVDFAGGLAMDRLRLGLRQAVLELAGRLSPALDLTATLRDVPADLAGAVVPDMEVDGVLNAEARLTGTIARPGGTLRLSAAGLHLRSGPGAALPPATLTADARLAGATAAVTARLDAGRNRLTLNGTAPIDPAAAMRLRAAGNIDLAALNPLLTASGRRVLGEVSLDATVTGTRTAPRVAGTLLLTRGDVQDFALGAHVTDLAARIEADGDTIRIARFTGRAGEGNLSARGILGLAGAMPVDLALTARRARPLASDRMTVTLDADLALRGELEGRLAASGTVRVDSAEIRIPDKLPPSIAVLDVRVPGERPSPPPAPPPEIALDIMVSAPGQVFVRGRGLFAEVAGRIKVGGTTTAPVPVGAFRLRRGEFNLAGTALTFTSGSVRFEGSGKLDPALNLVATSTSGNIIATLTVGGFASAPKITLTSTPPLPQDEILAQLLFHQSAGSLSPVQLASMAAALAQISGVGGGVFDPLNSVRQGLGLDRLTIAGGQDGSGPALEAGRYVARGIYVGAKQATSGAGTQATVQIDLMRGLKLEADVGTGGQTSATGAAATVNPYGTSVGITYQFRY